MTITEWMENFADAVASRQYNIYNTQTIKALKQAADSLPAEEFVDKAKQLFLPYEQSNISCSSLTGHYHPHSARALWLALDTIAAPAAGRMVSENGAPLISEDEKQPVAEGNTPQ